MSYLTTVCTPLTVNVAKITAGWNSCVHALPLAHQLAAQPKGHFQLLCSGLSTPCWWA